MEDVYEMRVTYTRKYYLHEQRKPTRDNILQIMKNDLRDITTLPIDMKRILFKFEMSFKKVKENVKN